MSPLKKTLCPIDFSEPPFEELGEFLCGHDLGHGYDLQLWEIW